MDGQLTAEGVMVKNAVLMGLADGTLTDTDIDWADDRRSDGVSANEIVLELLTRSMERRKRRRSEA